MRALDPVVEANRQLLLDRSRVGVEKYGTTLASAGLSRNALIRHALEEALDLSNYLQSLLMLADDETATHEHITKGGAYALVGVATGAGLSKLVAPLTIYRDVTSGALFFRTAKDFEDCILPTATSAPAPPILVDLAESMRDFAGGGGK